MNQITIPDIYKLNYDIYSIKDNKKYIIKYYTLKEKEKIDIYTLLKDNMYYTCNYIYIKTNFTQLYIYYHNYKYVNIYNNMIINIDTFDSDTYILNESDDKSDIIIYILLKKNWSISYLIENLYVDLYRKYKNILWSKESFLKYDSNLSIYYLYDIIYITTTSKINDNIIKFSSNNIDFYYYVYNIRKNYYELRLKKIFNKDNNKIEEFNINNNLNNLHENYKIMKNKILNINLKSNYNFYHINLYEISKIYHIKSYFSISKIFCIGKD